MGQRVHLHGGVCRADQAIDTRGGRAVFESQTPVHRQEARTARQRSVADTAT